MYQWFTTNLRGQQPVLRPLADHDGSPSSTSHVRSPLTFAVWLESPNGPDRTLCCPQASFHDGWLDNRDVGKRRKLFQCICEQICCSKEVSYSGTKAHQQKLNFYRKIFLKFRFSQSRICRLLILFAVLPVSLLVRTTGEHSEREWEMYVGSDTYTKPVLLILNAISTSGISSTLQLSSL